MATEHAALWIASPQFEIGDAQIQRLRGSRGQLTLTVKTAPKDVVWWIFSLEAGAPRFEPLKSGLRVNDAEFTLPEN